MNHQILAESAPPANWELELISFRVCDLFNHIAAYVLTFKDSGRIVRVSVTPDQLPSLKRVRVAALKQRCWFLSGNQLSWELALARAFAKGVSAVPSQAPRGLHAQRSGLESTSINEHDAEAPCP